MLKGKEVDYCSLRYRYLNHQIAIVPLRSNVRSHGNGLRKGRLDVKCTGEVSLIT